MKPDVSWLGLSEESNGQPGPSPQSAQRQAVHSLSIGDQFQKAFSQGYGDTVDAGDGVFRTGACCRSSVLSSSAYFNKLGWYVTNLNFRSDADPVLQHKVCSATAPHEGLGRNSLSDREVLKLDVGQLKATNALFPRVLFNGNGHDCAMFAVPNSTKRTILEVRVPAWQQTARRPRKREARLIIYKQQAQNLVSDVWRVDGMEEQSFATLSSDGGRAVLGWIVLWGQGRKIADRRLLFPEAC
ncbi:hypothetical protein PSPO01_12357 [Paraphaeosphaeria sporulosa]